MTTVLTEDNYIKNAKLGDSYEINSQLFKNKSQLSNFNIILITSSVLIYKIIGYDLLRES